MNTLDKAREWWRMWRATELKECTDRASDVMLAKLLDEVREDAFRAGYWAGHDDGGDLDGSHIDKALAEWRPAQVQSADSGDK